MARNNFDPLLGVQISLDLALFICTMWTMSLFLTLMNLNLSTKFLSFLLFPFSQDFLASFLDFSLDCP